jgi:hypothetical protein
MTPLYIIAASVAPGNRVKGFHSDRPDAPRFALRDAGELRPSGFDLGIGEAAVEAPDGSLQAVQGNRKVLRLYQDGTLVFRALADDSFLGWARRPEQFLAHPRLNPVPVVEVHASFATFYGRNILAMLEREPDEVLFKLVLKHHRLAEGKRLFMTEHQPGDAWEFVGRHYYRVGAEPPETTLTAAAAIVREKPLVVAYQLVEKFFALFDMPAHLIPFVSEVDGVHEIDVAKIGRR